MWKYPTCSETAPSTQCQQTNQPTKVQIEGRDWHISAGCLAIPALTHRWDQHQTP